LFRDVLDGGGVFQYTVELDVPGDPLVENNRGAGVVRVDAGPKLLALSKDGSAGNLVRALRAGGIPVDVAAASQHPLTADSLDPYRAVIVENVPANDLGRIVWIIPRSSRSGGGRADRWHRVSAGLLSP
jgi:hypothetical protein